MGTVLQAEGAFPGRARGPGRAQPHLSWRDELITVALATWAMVGISLDGWAHGKFGQADTFFTVWHGIFYAGVFATAAWILWPVLHWRRAGHVGITAVPRGYELGIVGLAIFVVGTVGDMLWHMGFGIEEAGKRLGSPAHLLLFVGGMLIVTSPFRAAWASSAIVGHRPSLREFLPALLSISLAAILTAIMFSYLWGFYSTSYLGVDPLWRLVGHFAQSDGATQALQTMTRARAISSVLVANLVLLAPVLVMLRRWRLPFGTVTIFFTLTATWMAAVDELRFVEAIGVALAGGLVADGLVQVLQLAPRTVGAFRTFATIVPLVLWSAYFLAEHLRWGLTMSPELWAGGIFITALSGLGLSVVMVPAADHGI